MYIAISMPTVVLVLLYRFEIPSYNLTEMQILKRLNFRMIPDSPRWLLRQGHVDIAKAIVLEGAAANKIKVPANLDQLLQAQAAAV